MIFAEHLVVYILTLFTLSQRQQVVMDKVAAKVDLGNQVVALEVDKEAAKEGLDKGATEADKEVDLEVAKAVTEEATNNTVIKYFYS